MHNLIMLTDSYKLSHWKQYPDNTKTVFSYLEARGGDSEEIVFFGLKYYLDSYLSNGITKSNIDEADSYAKSHGVPFNREGWEYILNNHNGKLPIKIYALPEGSIAKIGEPLSVIG